MIARKLKNVWCWLRHQDTVTLGHTVLGPLKVCLTCRRIHT